MTTHSDRNPHGNATESDAIPLDSALNTARTARESRDLGSSVSVRSPRATDVAAVTAAALIQLRPDWRYDALYDALRHDPRPWRTVVAAGFVCALDPQAHPALIPTTGPAAFTAQTGPTPTPPRLHLLRAADRCDHGAETGLCALCRHHIPAEATR